MEELLASIRKAIHEDIGEVSPVREPAPFRGSMRELRVNVAEEATYATNEIQELRNRIEKNRATINHVKPAAPPSRQITAVKSPGFASILGGEAERVRRQIDQSPPTALRPSFAASENQTPDYRYEARETEPSYRAEIPVMSAETSAAASAAFGRFADSILSRATGDKSVEDMTRELLRGMLKQWLDEHLPSLVERLVREEIERVARRGR